MKKITYGLSDVWRDVIFGVGGRLVDSPECIVFNLKNVPGLFDALRNLLTINASSADITCPPSAEVSELDNLLTVNAAITSWCEECVETIDALDDDDNLLGTFDCEIIEGLFPALLLLLWEPDENGCWVRDCSFDPIPLSIWKYFEILLDNGPIVDIFESNDDVLGKFFELTSLCTLVLLEFGSELIIDWFEVLLSLLISSLLSSVGFI